MLMLKRLVTAFFLTGFLFFVILIGSLMVGGAIIGAKAAAEQGAMGYEQGYEVGRKAGEEFGRKYGLLVLLGSGGLAFVIGFGVSFSGILPWCREKPPTLPDQQY